MAEPSRFMARLTSGWPPRSSGSTRVSRRGLKPGRKVGRHMGRVTSGAGKSGPGKPIGPGR
jgi:hypothetical protein